MFAFRLNDDERPYTVFDIASRLREHGWLVPAYTYPANREDVAALRIVVKNGFTQDLADMLITDLTATVAHLDQLKEPLPQHPTSFHH